MEASEHVWARSAPARVLLIGCGQLGTRLGTRLVREGTEVVAVRRDPSGLPSAFAAVAADLGRPLAQPLPSADAMVITLPPDDQSSDGVAGYRSALEHLAQALPTVPPRVLFVSSTRVFDGVPGARPISDARKGNVVGPSRRVRRIGDRNRGVDRDRILRRDIAELERLRLWRRAETRDERHAARDIGQGRRGARLKGRQAEAGDQIESPTRHQDEHRQPVPDMRHRRQA